MTTLYIFPHPDDESFGPAPVIWRQTQRGEQVHLLTLTRGGATKMRFKYSYSIEEMGAVRVQEMHAVNEVLNFASMEILDWEDGGMKDMDPLAIEEALLERIDRLRPNILVTYAVHGISGHHDHLTIHPVVKHLFCKLRKDPKYSFLKRLAFLTLPSPNDAPELGGNANVRTSKAKDIDCIIQLNTDEKSKLKEALYCYETFMDVIEETNVIEHIGDKVYFEFFDEDYKWASELSEDL